MIKVILKDLDSKEFFMIEMDILSHINTEIRIFIINC
jgi:hypothetical protein